MAHRVSESSSSGREGQHRRAALTQWRWRGRSLVSALLAILTAACGAEPSRPPAPAPVHIATTEVPAAEAPVEERAVDAEGTRVVLEPGFMPDPHVVEGNLGGNLDAQTFAPDCVGWVREHPDVVLVTSSSFGTLRILAASDSDVTLVVQTPGGGYHCDDDSEATDPIIELSSTMPGNYRIWVGSYAQGELAPYRLGFSELPSMMPSSIRP